ncbi:Clavaminate synthase-like protein [Trichoderma citrinoviride]|uniref:Clavaminate synthase-like protein n=1 Tax=Trichoderma citrinoviride TaxID=58853 RepID=A0A2T4BAL2_9HYPO|nr:Clavaminate synthase-like protein [Trichoderma citrinoviride]PTB66249.1 Clavaminate synthase-like protein [Trichoderma citrinoviride]
MSLRKAGGLGRQLATYATVASRASIHPIAHPPGSGIRFGAVVHGVNVDKISDADFDIIKDALYKHQILVFKAQHDASSRAQYEITQRFDPKATASYGHGKTLDAKRSILHPDLKTIPHQPQVQVIGNGFVEEYEGLKDIQLRHPHHKTFHATVIPEEEDLDFTRFYRWHIDAALYGLAPPVATTLFAARVPRGRRQTIRYEDTGEELDVPLGTTAFVSGYTMYDLLSPEDQQFAMSTKVEYAPHPYVWMSGAKSRSDGLGLISEGKEVPLDSLPEIEQDKIQILPMCWRNPQDGRLALQVHPSAVRKLHLAGGEVIDDLKEVREIVHRLQRPGIAPKYVYAHDWEEGDFVIFHNRSLLHSVVGAFAEDEVRLFRQCNIAGSSLPEGPRYL